MTTVKLQDVRNLLDYARHFCTNENLPNNKEWRKLHEEGVTSWNNALAYIDNELVRLYGGNDLAASDQEANTDAYKIRPLAPPSSAPQEGLK